MFQSSIAEAGGDVFRQFITPLSREAPLQDMIKFEAQGLGPTCEIDIMRHVTSLAARNFVLVLRTFSSVE